MPYKSHSHYVVTGVLVNGRRFRPITTNFYLHADSINLWCGSVWEVFTDGTRRLIKRVSN